MTGFDKLISKSLIFLVFLICQLILTEAVLVEPMCSKFSYDEQLLEKMMRMEFFVENVQKDAEKTFSNVMDVILDIKGNTSELSNRLLEQQEKVEHLERQTDILNKTTAIVASENTESIRSIAAVVKDIRNDIENNTSVLDNLMGITDAINKKCEDGLSDLSKNLDRQTSVFIDTMANKSIVSENTESIKSMTLNVENIKENLEKSTSGLDDLKTVTGEVKASCKDGLLDLSNKFAALEKQIKELDHATEKKSQSETVAFNVMDAVSYSGYEAIKFSNIVLNEGDSYDKDTGIFTAPTDGIYQFNAHICITIGAQEIDYYIKVGDNSIVTGEFFVPVEAKNAKCTSFSAAALVRKGESVRVGGMPASSLNESSDDQCSFSGTLIQNV